MKPHLPGRNDEATKKAAAPSVTGGPPKGAVGLAVDGKLMVEKIEGGTGFAQGAPKKGAAGINAAREKEKAESKDKAEEKKKPDSFHHLDLAA